MKSLFCWFIKSVLPIIGPILLCSVAAPYGFFDGGNAKAGFLSLVLEFVPAFFTTKFAANNYEEYFMGYYDWLASRVSFFETKTGFVIRTFVWSACFYSFFAALIAGGIFGFPKI